MLRRKVKLTVKAKHEKTDEVRELHAISFFSYLIESFFYRAQFFSPERLFTQSRTEIQNVHSEEGPRKENARKRGRAIEKYIFVCLILEVLIVIGTTCTHRLSLLIPLGILASIRLLDIIQMTVNRTLFDHFRIQGKKYWVESSVRTLILSLINYLELMVCYGVLYAILITQGAYFKGANSALDGYYFSGITQLTIGYGDVIPLGIAKIVTLSQGLIGLIFALFVLSRFISLLPEFEIERKS